MSSNIRRYVSSEHRAVPSRPSSGSFSIEERRLWLEKGREEAEARARVVLLELARQFVTADQLRDIDQCADIELMGRRIASAIQQDLMHVSWHE